MDISRLPVAPLARPANTTVNATPRAAPAPPVEPVASVERSRQREETFARVVQGELLHRDRPSVNTQSTRSFIDERNLEHAQTHERRHSATQRTRAALSLYQNNTRPEAAADLTQGRSVNFFV